MRESRSSTRLKKRLGAVSNVTCAARLILPCSRFFLVAAVRIQQTGALDCDRSKFHGESRIVRPLNCIDFCQTEHLPGRGSHPAVVPIPSPPPLASAPRAAAVAGGSLTGRAQDVAVGPLPCPPADFFTAANQFEFREQVARPGCASAWPCEMRSVFSRPCS
jgi:hypothetical protein